MTLLAPPFSETTPTIGRKTATISPIIVIGFERGKAYPPNGIFVLVVVAVHTIYRESEEDANITTNPAMMIESFKELLNHSTYGF